MSYCWADSIEVKKKLIATISQRSIKLYCFIKSSMGLGEIKLLYPVILVYYQNLPAIMPFVIVTDPVFAVKFPSISVAVNFVMVNTPVTERKVYPENVSL